jgi:colicin import membrane protein
MARKLKAYQTSLGFFDLAIAAPSMKAALDAWGAESNLFHQGVAKESTDPDVIAATMSKHGVILRRPVGSSQPFRENAELPRFSSNEIEHRPDKRHITGPKKRQRRTIDDKAASKAALEFKSEQRRRESERRKEEAARDKQHGRRDRAIARAQAAIDKAKQEHERKVNAIEAERATLEKRVQAEEARWKKQIEKLETALRRARD